MKIRGECPPEDFLGEHADFLAVVHDVPHVVVDGDALAGDGGGVGLQVSDVPQVLEVETGCLGGHVTSVTSKTSTSIVDR